MEAQSSYKQGIRAKGRVEVFGVLPDGSKVLRYRADNLVVDTGLSFLADRLKDNTVAFPSHIGVGTSATGPSPTDTALVSELGRNALTDADATLNEYICETEFTTSQAVGTWREAGIFNNSIGGVMFNRVNVNYAHGAENTVIRFTITFTNV